MIALDVAVVVVDVTVAVAVDLATGPQGLAPLTGPTAFVLFVALSETAGAMVVLGLGGLTWHDDRQTDREQPEQR